MQIYIITDPQ